MSAIEDIVFRLRAPWEATDAAQLAQGPELRIASGQQLVGIRLVARVPHDSVARRLQDAMQGDRQLDHTKRRAEMPSGPGNGRDDVFTDLGGQRLELIVAEAAQFAGSLQGGQDGQLHTLLGGSPNSRRVWEASPVKLDAAFCLPGSSLPRLRVGAAEPGDGPAGSAVTALFLVGDFRGPDLGRLKRSGRPLEQLLNAQFGRSQQGGATLMEGHAALVQRYGALQRQAALLKLGDRTLQFDEGIVKRKPGDVHRGLRTHRFSHHGSPPARNCLVRWMLRHRPKMAAPGPPRCAPRERGPVAGQGEYQLGSRLRTRSRLPRLSPRPVPECRSWLGTL